MLRKAPPLEGIEVFVAAARAKSFRAVARDLALSPSAVSRRIASLERFLSVSLFDRSDQAQTLSAAGRRYLALVEPAVGAIQRATTLVGEPGAHRLTIAASHSFAAAWIAPRLAELQQDHGLDIEVIPTRDFDVLRSGEAQLAIWGGRDVPDDMTATHLFDARTVPVAAPRLASGRRLPTSEAELPQHVLLAVRTPSRMWERWLALAGLHPDRLEIREFATLQLMYEAAVAGLGVTLGMPLLAEAGLASGRLLPCTPTARPLGDTYRLYRAPGRGPCSPAEQRFTKWLRHAVAESLRRFEDFVPSSRPVDRWSAAGSGRVATH